MATTTISGDLGTEIISDTIGYRSAESTFAFYGDFGGGTLTIEAAYDDDGLIFIPLRKPDGALLEIAQNEPTIGKSVNQSKSCRIQRRRYFAFRITCRSRASKAKSRRKWKARKT